MVGFKICKRHLVTHVIPIRIVYIFSHELKMADKDPFYAINFL